MRKKLLKIFRDEEITEEFMARYSEDIHADDLDSKFVREVIEGIAKVEGIDDYLKSIIKKDRIRYFNSLVEGQKVVRGAFLRTLWLLKKIRESREESPKLENKRYG